MAEGIEEAESNSGSGAVDATTSMLSAAMPCEIINPNIGSLKREFESYHNTIKCSDSSSPSPTETVLAQNNLSIDGIAHHQNRHQKQHKQPRHKQSTDEQEQSSPSQQQPINLKTEVNC